MIVHSFRRGALVNIEVDVVETLTEDDAPRPFDPDEGVTITIYAPDDTIMVNDQSMQKRWTGRYRYVWQTTEQMAYGVYESVRTKRNAGLVDRSLREATVELVAP